MGAEGLKKVSEGVWMRRGRLFTLSMLPDDREYAKSVLTSGSKEFREWDPRKSKPAAAIVKGLKEFPLKKGMKLLYLGVASGATASFFSDIVGPEGVIYGVEISERCVHDLNALVNRRGNIVPILADARKPDDYSWVEPVDLVYEDVASDEQSGIMIRNAKAFLKPGGHAVLAIKSRSIDVTKDPKDVYRQVLEKLGKHFEILEKVELDPYELDHLFVVMKLK